MTEKTLKQRIKRQKQYEKELDLVIKQLIYVRFDMIKSNILADRTGLSVAKCGRLLSIFGYSYKNIREGNKVVKFFYHPYSEHYNAGIPIGFDSFGAKT